MARPKKEHKAITVTIAKDVSDELTAFSNKTGLTKTLVVEKGVQMFIAHWNKYMKENIL